MLDVSKPPSRRGIGNGNGNDQTVCGTAKQTALAAVAPYIPAQVRRRCLGAVPACAIGRGFTAQGISTLEQGRRSATSPAELVTMCYAAIAANNHPPAKPGVFNIVSRSKRLNGVANAAPTRDATETVAVYLHSPSCSKRSSSFSWCRM